jgi:DNA mismatch endonuclease (patch repair protein)
MQGQARRDTKPERLLRSALHQLGLRYRVHVRLLPESRRQVDVAFMRERVAVFVDGCFWHGCPEHGHQPRVNDWYWGSKIMANRARDADTDERLEEAAWQVVRVWEHESPEIAAIRIQEVVLSRRMPRGSP